MNIELLVIIFVFIIAVGVILYITALGTKEIQKDFVDGGGRIQRVERTNIVKDLIQNPRSKSEQFVIDIFEKHTGEKFPTMRPKWLVYNGKQLELDGYCEKLAIAVEFSGPMHTKWYPNKESHAKYLERIKRDEAKIKICRENNVRLFVIDMRIPKHQMHTYVKSRLYDVGKGPRPANYIPEEIYAPDIDYSRK